MELQEVMKRFGGNTERLPDGQIKSGREVNLVELIKVLDQWRNAREGVDDNRTLDHRRYGEKRRSQQPLGYISQVLKRMTFSFNVIGGYPKELIREHLERENPDKEAAPVIKDLFRSDGWYLLIAITKGRDGSDNLDFCHTNTREVVRLRISANSPIAKHYELADPAEPRGNVVIF